MLLFLLLTFLIFTQGSQEKRLLHKDGNYGRDFIGDKEYFFGTVQNVNPITATETCLELNMKLLSLETEEEANLLYQYMAENGLNNGRYWTSGRRILDNTHWQWACGQFFTYTAWAEGKPNYTGAGDPCVALDPLNGWFDFSCTSLNKFICEA